MLSIHKDLVEFDLQTSNFSYSDSNLVQPKPQLCVLESAEKSKPNGKLGPSDNLLHNNNTLLLGANLNPQQFICSPRLEKRDNGSSWEVKRELEELQWDDTISLQRPRNHEAGFGPPLIGCSPTPWGTRDLESNSSSWDRSQCTRRGFSFSGTSSSRALQ